MYKVVFTKEAKDCFDSILEYIAQYDFDTAVSFLASLEAKAQSLSNFPMRGVRYPNNERKIIWKKYLIYYHIDEQKKLVSIETIRHGAMKERK